MSRGALRASLAAAWVLGSLAAEATAREVMQDRCKQDVVFIPFNPKIPGGGRPGEPGTVILKRRSDGRSDWSRIFQGHPAGKGRVGWWCYTGPGTEFEPGVWQVNLEEDGSRCPFSDVIANCLGDSKVRHNAPVWARDWTAEQSRCRDGSTKFRARLGPKRSLQIECMGRE